MDEIDGPSPTLVRALAAQGFAVEDIAGMTRSDPAYVREVLAQQTGPTPTDKVPSVNTTSPNK